MFKWKNLLQKPPTEEFIKVNKIDRINLVKIKEIVTHNIFTPSNFNEYIGQDKVKHILSKYIESTKSRNIIFPHTIISSKAGMGKSTLAKIIAKSLNKELVEIISSSIVKDKNVLQNIVLGLEGKILFIDEIHSLPRKEAETIYTLMENFTFNDKKYPFTLIGATTEVGEVIKTKKPFYDRFKLPLELEDYTYKNLITIAKQYREEVFKQDKIKENNYKLIAENSRYTPRILIRLLESVIYFNEDIDRVLDSFNIIYNGYTQKDLKLLEYLSKNKIVGLQGIASFLDTSKENYLYELEPYLIKENVIIRTPRGRSISDNGLKILKQLREKTK